jgi:hypothetical protein
MVIIFHNPRVSGNEGCALRAEHSNGRDHAHVGYLESMRVITDCCYLILEAKLTKAKEAARAADNAKNEF